MKQERSEEVPNKTEISVIESSAGGTQVEHNAGSNLVDYALKNMGEKIHIKRSQTV